MLDPGSAKAYTTAVRMTFGILILAVAALFLLGWLIPLIVGILRVRRRRGGTAWIVIGGVWGAVAIGLIGFVSLAIVGFRSASARAEPKLFDAAAHDGPTGWLRMGGTGASELYVQADGMPLLQLRSTNGTFVAPATSVTIQRFETSASAPDGATWTASGYLYGRETVKVDVAPGGTTEVALGPPFRAVVSASTMEDGRQSFDLAITDAGGHRVMFYPQGMTRKPMRFEAVDASGQAVWSGNFEYG